MRSEAFRLHDVHLSANGYTHNAHDNSLNDVRDLHISSATVTFTDQKNAVRGKQLGHKATNDPLLCPCKALARIGGRLCAAGAPANTPLFTHYNGNGMQTEARSELVHNGLRHAAKSIEQQTGIDPVLLSTRSLRPGGANDEGKRET